MRTSIRFVVFSDEALYQHIWAYQVKYRGFGNERARCLENHLGTAAK
jgi:hypothetical protein